MRLSRLAAELQPYAIFPPCFLDAVYAYLGAYFATYDSCQFNAYMLAHMVSWLEPS